MSTKNDQNPMNAIPTSTLPAPQSVTNIVNKESDLKMKSKTAPPLNYKNGRKLEPMMFNFNNYFVHREKLPKHYHPLVQYLDQTEVKFHNDNLFENSPLGFPTRAQLLKERLVRFPIVKQTSAERERYRRKLQEQQNNLNSAKRKYQFTTYDDYSSHAFLTGARFNRNDTIDSKILSRYGMFINRHNPNSLYMKSNRKAYDSISDDLQNIPPAENYTGFSAKLIRSKSIQVTPSLYKHHNLQGVE